MSFLGLVQLQFAIGGSNWVTECVPDVEDQDSG